MKKKIIGILLTFILIITLASCEKKPSYEPVHEVSEYALAEEKACFDFFWETQVSDESLYSYGLIPDRYPSNGLASIASVGFGLAAIPIGIENGWIKKAEGEERVIKTLASVDELTSESFAGLPEIIE